MAIRNYHNIGNPELSRELYAITYDEGGKKVYVLARDFDDALDIFSCFYARSVPNPQEIPENLSNWQTTHARNQVTGIEKIINAVLARVE